jgi:hypothetical protein
METRTARKAFIERIIPQLKHPHLFLLLLVLFLVDMIFPDPLPFVDELVLALLTFLLGSWRTRREASPIEKKSPDSAINGPKRSSQESVTPAQRTE